MTDTTNTTDAAGRTPGVLVRRAGEVSPEMRAEMDALRARRAAALADLPTIRTAGVAALERLLKIAQGSSGQCRYVARFLLGLYNGTRFPFDMTNFRCLDRVIFKDCIAVLAMDYQPLQEVHRYFDRGDNEGGQIWEDLAVRWRVQDRSGDHECY